MEEKFASRAFFCVLFFQANVIFASDTLKLSSKPPPKKISTLFDVGYRIPVNSASIVNSGHGIYAEGGINFGKLIAENLTLGVFGGMAMKDRFWSTSFNPQFVKDYGNSIDKEQTGLDSVITFSSAELFKNSNGNDFTLPGCENRAFHNYSLYYGIVLNFPLRFFSGVKIYTGSLRSHFRGGGNMITKRREYNILELRRKMYGAEIFLLNIDIGGKKKAKGKFHKNFCVSAFYEACNFYNSTLHFSDGEVTRNLPLKKFTSVSFLDKYRNEKYWGLKLSFQLG